MRELRLEFAELRTALGIESGTWLTPAEAGRLLGKPQSTIKSACRQAYRDMCGAPDFSIWVEINGDGRAKQVKGAPIPERLHHTVGTVLAKLDDTTSDPRKRTRQSYLIRRRDILRLKQEIAR